MQQSHDFWLGLLESFRVEDLQQGEEEGGCRSQETQGSLSFFEHIADGVDELLGVVLVRALFEDTSETEDGLSPDVEADLVGYGDLDDGVCDGVNQNIGYDGCDHGKG